MTYAARHMRMRVLRRAVSVNTLNYALSPSSFPGYVSGSFMEFTINTGIYLYSDSQTQPALTLSGFAPVDTVVIINKGAIMGCGGDAPVNAGGLAASNGGHAILVASPCALRIETSAAFIGGGGGAGGAGYSPNGSGTYGGSGAGGGKRSSQAEARALPGTAGAAGTGAGGRIGIGASPAIALILPGGANGFQNHVEGGQGGAGRVDRIFAGGDNQAIAGGGGGGFGQSGTAGFGGSQLTNNPTMQAGSGGALGTLPTTPFFYVDVNPGTSLPGGAAGAAVVLNGASLFWIGGVASSSRSYGAVVA